MNFQEKVYSRVGWGGGWRDGVGELRYGFQKTFIFFIIILPVDLAKYSY